MDLSPYEDAAARYAPSRTRVLFVAESPPASLNRYFYYPDVREHDHLWIGLMKALYPTEFGETRDTREERLRKRYWLERFQADGYRLIDAVKKPLTGTPRKREAAIRGNTARVIEQIREIGPEQVVLIKATVWKGLRHPLRNAGIPVVNEELLPFPGSGWQKEFRAGFRALVDSGRLRLAPRGRR